MTHRLFATVASLLLAGAADAAEPAASLPLLHLNYVSAFSGQPSAADPKPIHWTRSNSLVGKLRGPRGPLARAGGWSQAVSRRLRLQALALAIGCAALAGCASVDSDQAIATARDRSQRVDAQAPQLRTEGPSSGPWQAQRERLLAAPLSEDAAVQLAMAQSPALQVLLADGWRAQAEAAQRGAPPNPIFLFERVVTAGDVDITRMLGIGLTELLTWPWRSDIAQRDIDALRLQLAREVLAHSAEVRAAWVRAVAAQQLVIHHRQVQDAAAAGAELAWRMQAVGNFSQQQRARAGLPG